KTWRSICEGFVNFLKNSCLRLFPRNGFHQFTNVFAKVNHCWIDGIEVWFSVKIERSIQKMVDAVSYVKLGLGSGISVYHVKHSVYFFVWIYKRLLRNAVCLSGMVISQVLCVSQ